MAQTERKTSRTLAIIKLGLPILIGQLGMIIVGFADTKMVGLYSTEALASASFVNNLFNVCIFACVGFTYGLTPLIGALFSQKRLDAIGNTLRNGVIINILFALLLTAIMTVVYINLHRLGQPEELLPLIRPYFLIYLAGLIPVALFNVFAQWAYAINRTKIITEPPRELSLSVRDKGTVLANYSLSGGKTLKLNYSDMVSDVENDRVTLSQQALENRLRSFFDPTTQIVSVRPDSLSLIVTDRAPNLARVVPDVEVTPASQFVISGPIKVEPDTVSVYTARHLRVRPRTVSTVKITRSELRDTLIVDVRLQPEADTRVVPSKVRLTIPIEPLISKSREVGIQLTHASSADAVVLFPSRVRVSYLLPMSLYNSENNVVTVTADFARRHGGKIPLTIGALPDYYRGVELSTDSVEYLVEQKVAHPAAK